MDANMLIAQLIQEGVTHATWAALICYALQALKRSVRFRWVTPDTKAVNAWISFLSAGAVALGIGIVSTGSSATGFDVHIHIPPLAALAAGALDWGKQYATNQFFYDKVVQPSGTARPADVAGAVRDALMMKS